MDKKLMVLIWFAAFDILLLLFGFFANSYTIFVDDNLDENLPVIDDCVSSFKDCRCFGILWTSSGERQMDKYTCIGVSFCRDTQVDKCEEKGWD